MCFAQNGILNVLNLYSVERNGANLKNILRLFDVFTITCGGSVVYCAQTNH